MSFPVHMMPFNVFRARKPDEPAPPPGNGNGNGNGDGNGEPEAAPFAHTDFRTGTTIGSPFTFNNVDFGDEHADRELVIEVSGSHSSLAWSGNSVPAASVVAGGVTLTVINRVRVSSGFSAICRGNVPEDGDNSVVINSTGSVPPNRLAIKVYRGVGPFVMDSFGTSGSIGGSVLLPGGLSKFAVATRASTEADTSIVGLEMQRTNESAGTSHRVSCAYEDKSGAVTVSSEAASNLAAMSLVQGDPLNIALITADTGHAAATNTRDSLQSFGHTVTMVAQADAGTHDFSGYDLVLVARGDSPAGDLIGIIRGLIDSGTPVVLHHRGGLAEGLDLTGDWSGIFSDNADIEITNNEHPITDGFDLSTFAVYTENNFRGWLLDSEPFVGTKLGDIASESLPYLIAIDQGTQDLEDETINARVVVFGWSYGPYTALGATLLNRMALWAAGRIGG